MAIMRRKNISVLPDAETDKLKEFGNAKSLLELASSSGISLEPLDLNALVAKLGIALRLAPMEDQKSGYIKKEEGRWVIGVNSLHHPNRQRFTIAHELGHYFLHNDQIGDGLEDSILFRADGYGASGIERDANIFASELLMPEEYFRAVVATCGGDIKKISEVLKVSALAVSVRAKVLGYKESK